MRCWEAHGGGEGQGAGRKGGRVVCKTSQTQFVLQQRCNSSVQQSKACSAGTRRSELLGRGFGGGGVLSVREKQLQEVPVEHQAASVTGANITD